MSITSHNSILLKKGEIYDPKTKKYSNGSILIENGRVSKVGKEIIAIDSKKTLVINCNGKIICPGFIDINSNIDFFGRPDRETVESATLSSMSGGYTKVCISPIHSNVHDNPEVILSFLDKVNDNAVKFFPLGASTMGCKGQELAEIGMMFKAGAVGISNGYKNLENTLMLRYVLEYLKSFKSPLIHSCYDKFLSDRTYMNEGNVSMKMGVSSSPSISETVDAYRVLSLASYLEGEIHLSSITSFETIKLLESFSSNSFFPTYDIPVHNLYFSDLDLFNFETNLKSNAFFRSNENREKIISHLKAGKVKCISSNHRPLSSDEKEKDFYSSLGGFISLQTSFSLACKSVGTDKKSLGNIIDCFTLGPSEILNLPLDFTESGSKASFAIIDLKNQWQFDRGNSFSNSFNTPLNKMKFPVSICGTISGNQIYLK